MDTASIVAKTLFRPRKLSSLSTPLSLPILSLPLYPRSLFYYYPVMLSGFTHPRSGPCILEAE